mgnify:CR=1 FL=1
MCPLERQWPQRKGPEQTSRRQGWPKIRHQRPRVILNPASRSNLPVLRRVQLSPWSGVIDSQSINPSHTKAHNYNAGKEIVGRQRHIVVDMDDRLILVVRDISDIALRTYDPRRWLWVKHLLADGAACDIFRLMDKVAFLDCTVGIIRRSDATKGRSFSRLFNSERK